MLEVDRWSYDFELWKLNVVYSLIVPNSYTCEIDDVVGIHVAIPCASAAWMYQLMCLWP